MLSTAVLDSFCGKRCLVTGGTGLIGRQVVDILHGAGADVTQVSLDDIVVNDAVQHVKGDLSDLSLCCDLCAGMDFVLHVAGVKGSINVTLKKPASFFVPLLMMNTNMLEASRRNNIKKLVYTSSIGAYPDAEIFYEALGSDGQPMDSYPGWAKRMAEMQIQAYKIQYGLQGYSVVRPCNVYGPGDNFDPENAMVVPTLLHRIHRGDDPVLIWGDGAAVRDFAYSRDIAAGIILALHHGTGELPFLNLGSGEGCSIRELVETLQQFIEFTPFFDTTKPSGFPRRVMDITNARKLLGYSPQFSLRMGLDATWEWYKQNNMEFMKRQNYFVERDDSTS